MELFVEDGKGLRRVEPGHFPLTIGGRESDIEIPFELAKNWSRPLALLGFSSGERFVEPQGARVEVNGVAVSGSYWLSPGDVIGIGPIALEVVEKPGALGLRVRTNGDAAAIRPIEPGPPGTIEKPKTLVRRPRV